MSNTVTIDLKHVARGLGIPLRQVQSVVELLDDGNTVPFITRYRKDQTGGLDEEQIRQVQSRLIKARLLADRKQTILRSIESQGKLTAELAEQILAAGSTKRLEDLYLPFKPKKQTLATAARIRGLEPLAREVLAADPLAADLDARAKDFVNPDKQVHSAADALLGAGHILAEQFSENAELRQRLRDIMQRTGRIQSTQVVADAKTPEARAVERALEKSAEPAADPTAARLTPADPPPASREAIAEPSSSEASSAAGTLPVTDAAGTLEAAADAASESTADVGLEATNNGPTTADLAFDMELSEDAPAQVSGGPMVAQDPSTAQTSPADLVPAAAMPVTDSPAHEPAAPEGSALSNEALEYSDAAAEETSAAVAAERNADAATESTPSAAADAPPGAVANRPAAQTAAAASAGQGALKPPAPLSSRAVAKAREKAAKQAKKDLKRKRLEEMRNKAFRDYFNYEEEIRKIPPHRVLAINRGERAKVLRVRMEYDVEAMHHVLDEILVPAEHPHQEYLRGCARDALQRLILPSLERELRRELTERAEQHAVDVFAKNLRNLLLQPPIHDRRVLAIDPGYKSGCKLVALDQFGNTLEHGVIFLVGKPERRDEAKQKACELIDRYQLTVIAIGNGTACRAVEDFVAEMLTAELKDKGVAYVIVNEAGASAYSTSRLGREEFPDYDATLRGAISIGRRLQDPLSELVKIEPANIGVGLYQHDVRAKHLETSLDEVVESCVNYVGVEVNTASPALLRYVSGLNQLTARRVYEHRREHGPFRNRQQLLDVAGFGEATFVQAAGFLRISGGDNPLDATWIHPESYALAEKLLERLGSAPAELRDKQAVVQLAGRVKELDRETLGAELSAGVMTLNDILSQFARPGRDPREDLPPPVFKQGILKLEDLVPGMELTGTVLNVVDFGAFVDIGMHDSGLVHVSHLADRFVRDPHEVVAVGDIVKVWVKDVDKERRRVSLTMVRPGSERQRPPRGDRAQGQRDEHSSGQGQRREGGRPPRAPGGSHGDGPRSSHQRGGPPRGGQPVGAPRGEGPSPEGQPIEASGTGAQGDLAYGGRATHGDRSSQYGSGYGGRQGGYSAHGQRPPRGGGDRGGQRAGGQRGGASRGGGSGGPPRPRYEAPKPLIPITEEMKQGKAPLRTFGDLLQFYEHKHEVKLTERPPETPKGKKDRPGKQKPPTQQPAAGLETAEAAAAHAEPAPASGDAVPDVAAAASNHAPAGEIAISNAAASAAPPSLEIASAADLAGPHPTPEAGKPEPSFAEQAQGVQPPSESERESLAAAPPAAQPTDDA